MARKTKGAKRQGSSASAKTKKAKSAPLITQVRLEGPAVKTGVFMDNWASMKAFGRQLAKAQGLSRKADKPDKKAEQDKEDTSTSRSKPKKRRLCS